MQEFQNELNHLPEILLEERKSKSLSTHNGELSSAYLEHIHNEQTKDDDQYSRDDVMLMYDAADAFVLSTKGEGWGLPIAEAMSMALPVIVTDAPGPRAYTNSQNAYIIPILSGLDSLSFVQPNVTALSHLMQQVIRESQSEGGYLAQRKGAQARSTMQQITGESIVEIISNRLKFHAQRRGWQY
jgi:glycosyltransferase involved in cell wall biosynthesis